MKNWLWLATLSIVLIGIFSLMELGPKYFGKSYLETYDFKEEYRDFINRLVVLELDPPTAETEFPVTMEEIEEYRTRYGTLAEQLQSIQDQYNPDIDAAREAGNDSLAEILTEERDGKIGMIRDNFADDDTVRGKILEEKQMAAKVAVKGILNEEGDFNSQYSYYVYHLTNTETGENFRKGDLVSNPFFEKKYSNAVPLQSTNDELYYSNYNNTEMRIPGSDSGFKGIVQIDRSLLASSDRGISLIRHHYIQNMLYILGALAIAGIVLLFTKLRFERNAFLKMPLYKRWAGWSLEIKLSLLIISLLIAIPYGLINTLWEMEQVYYDNPSNFIWQNLKNIALTTVFLGLLILQSIWFFSYYKSSEKLVEDYRNSYLERMLQMVRYAFLKKSMGVQMLLLLIVVFFWGVGTLLVFIMPEAILIWIPATLFIGLPVLLSMLKRFGYMNVLMDSTQAIADGSLNEQIPVRGRSPLAQHAVQLNRLKEGVRLSMSEQAKSERLKTELITNVSHDLRTPLTSIITYTDLMKTPELSTEDRLAYAEILDRKSQRLKTLIEDLFEVSKMASGNMELNRQRVDFTQLMTQAFAEHAEDIAASGLDFRISSPEQPVYILADGQKWWRVLDNLILNAIKYALPGTRVFATLKETDGQAEFVMKNVTRFELGENTDELFERFKRGDVARQTEGSGLGLAIAQSIVDLHGGTMKIEVDGDLFKVTVSLPRI
ncbi:HAMP domain-containing sensor histidine kinase [Planococcus salinarum]|uniref:HAMP domain-containing sensor histidine kinase n=1 Tax=Planococcus salinarum TaxID=622695 RepID=UPI000E3C275F|nr:HAMP domain-containing sensor histidine kinase [Planococcus salinarum]TAA73614.1 HAMP domain-containing histidine kinase [Planococcus salinarum]